MQEEITEDFKKELENKIIQFVSSEKYRDFLMKNILFTIKNMEESNMDNIHLFITNNDIANYGELIKDKIKLSKIEVMDDENLGGCQILNKKSKVMIDNTLKLAINEQIENIVW